MESRIETMFDEYFDDLRDFYTNTHDSTTDRDMKVKENTLHDYKVEFIRLTNGGLEKLETEELLERLVFTTENYMIYDSKNEWEWEDLSIMFDLVNLYRLELLKRANIGTKFMELMEELNNVV